ncbi:hypothetical protein PV762_23415 [Mitsuaria sp. CC2]|uniref:hypothetical protein n=1 Tax=Mitsuaria sp. CC2 TaxID=3029186 RepID=UPI003B8BF915
MSANQQKWSAVPMTAMERRTDNSRREAYEQRDRSKRLGMAPAQTKSASKLDAIEPGGARFI